VSDVIDRDRYPSGQAELVAELHERLARDGVCELPGFVRPRAVEEAVGEAASLAGDWFATDEEHTVYFEPIDEDAPSGDPRGMRLRSSKKQIAYDQIPESSPVRRLYEDEETLRFVAGVLGLEELYRLDDPLAALGYAYMEPGDTLAWHFDRSEFAVTLMLQTAERGGAFQYVPNVRSEADERPELVAAVLEERSDQVVSLHPQPGTLTLFRGRRSLHRVSPVEGGRVRVNAVLAYGHEPGMRLNELTQRLFYGRVA
jgi:hypothetical protein